MTDDNAVLQRLDSLEKENHKLKNQLRAFCMSIIGAITIGTLTAANHIPSYDTLRIKKLIVEDNKGQIRSILSTENNGDIVHSYYDYDGVERIRHGIMDGSIARHRMFNEHGQSRLSSSVHRDDSDAKGYTGISIYHGDSNNEAWGVEYTPDTQEVRENMGSMIAKGEYGIIQWANPESNGLTVVNPTDGKRYTISYDAIQKFLGAKIEKFENENVYKVYSSHGVLGEFSLFGLYHENNLSLALSSHNDLNSSYLSVFTPEGKKPMSFGYNDGLYGISTTFPNDEKSFFIYHDKDGQFHSYVYEPISNTLGSIAKDIMINAVTNYFGR